MRPPKAAKQVLEPQAASASDAPARARCRAGAGSCGAPGQRTCGCPSPPTGARTRAGACRIPPAWRPCRGRGRAGQGRAGRQGVSFGSSSGVERVVGPAAAAAMQAPLTPTGTLPPDAPLVPDGVLGHLRLKVDDVVGDAGGRVVRRQQAVGHRARPARGRRGEETCEETCEEAMLGAGGQQQGTAAAGTSPGTAAGTQE